MRTDAHTLGLTGTEPLSDVLGVAAVALQNRHFETIWRCEKTRCSKMSARVSMNSRYQVAQEATARGGDLRRTTEIAGESEGGEAQELAGRPHRESKYWFGAVEQVTLETFFGLVGWRRKLLPHRGSWFNTWRSPQSFTAETRLFLQVVVDLYPEGWAAAFWVHFFQRGIACRHCFFFLKFESGASVCETWRLEPSRERKSTTKLRNYSQLKTEGKQRSTSADRANRASCATAPRTQRKRRWPRGTNKPKRTNTGFDSASLKHSKLLN